jgi:hypothetical protein
MGKGRGARLWAVMAVGDFLISVPQITAVSETIPEKIWVARRAAGGASESSRQQCL